MDKQQHTPGPWHRSEIGEQTYIIGHPTWPCARNGQEGEWEVATLDELLGEHSAEVKANARLIAAAPDLLALSRFLLERLDEFERDALTEDDIEYIGRQFAGHISPAIGSLRAAIATAEAQP